MTRQILGVADRDYAAGEVVVFTTCDPVRPDLPLRCRIEAGERLRRGFSFTAGADGRLVPVRDTPQGLVTGESPTAYPKSGTVHHPAEEEPNPPGFDAFVRDVRARLEPFGVEVRFEIRGGRVYVHAGMFHNGKRYLAQRVMGFERFPYTWSAVSTAHHLMDTLQKGLGGEVEPPPIPFKNRNDEVIGRVVNVRAETRYGERVVMADVPSRMILGVDPAVPEPDVAVVQIVEGGD